MEGFGSGEDTATPGKVKGLSALDQPNRLQLEFPGVLAPGLPVFSLSHLSLGVSQSTRLQLPVEADNMSRLHIFTVVLAQGVT